jgi:hypothetical protein
VSAAAPATGDSGLERLRALLREGGGLMATLVVSDTTNGRPASPACLAAGGPRAAGRREEYELLVEAIYEGYLLHYGAPRVVSVPEADVRLLAGDQLYAIGLARLVEPRSPTPSPSARSPRAPGTRRSPTPSGRPAHAPSDGVRAALTTAPSSSFSVAIPER